jgi:hypothetical protein
MTDGCIRRIILAGAAAHRRAAIHQNSDNGGVVEKLAHGSGDFNEFGTL